MTPLFAASAAAAVRLASGSRQVLRFGESVTSGSATPVWTYKGRFQAIAAWGRMVLYPICYFPAWVTMARTGSASLGKSSWYVKDLKLRS